jgi:Fur family ferric uptake transcriptional regulator
MGRISRIPEAVVGVMDNSEKDCWTIEEIQLALSLNGIQADFSSVFRAANKLEEQKVLYKVDLNDGKSHFELRSEHHDHLICERCQLVSKIPCDFFDKSIGEMVSKTGFNVLRHSLVVEGVCKQCTLDEGER